MPRETSLPATLQLHLQRHCYWPGLDPGLAAHGCYVLAGDRIGQRTRL